MQLTAELRSSAGETCADHYDHAAADKLSSPLAAAPIVDVGVQLDASPFPLPLHTPPQDKVRGRH